MRDPARLLPGTYAARFATQVQYSDVDANRHVNNVAYARWFEEARSRLHLRVFGERQFLDPPPGVMLMLASTSISYLSPVGYPAEITAATLVTRVGAASWAYGQALFHDGRCAALGEALMVKALDGRPTRLTPAERDALAELAGLTSPIET